MAIRNALRPLSKQLCITSCFVAFILFFCWVKVPSTGPELLPKPFLVRSSVALKCFFYIAQMLRPIGRFWATMEFQMSRC